jgi:hypothetical protein
MTMAQAASLLLAAGLAGLGAVTLAAGAAGDPGNSIGYNQSGADPAQEADPNLVNGPVWIFQGDWLEAGADADGSLWYVETHASDFTAWPLRVIARAHHPRKPGAGHSWTQREMEIDCDRNLYRILRTTHQDRAGRPGEANERGNRAFGEAAPGSGFDLVTRFVCDGPDRLPGRNLNDEMVRNSM